MKRWEYLLNRRRFLKVSAVSGLTLLLSNCNGRRFRTNSKLSRDEFIAKFGPIDRTLGDTTPPAFFGDDNGRPHRIFYNLPFYLKNNKVQDPIETANMVIVGGGMSGLFSAYTFRKHKPIILEQASRLGGNAKGQSWNGVDYAIGAAYLDTPHVGQPMYDYFEELGLREILVPRYEVDPVENDGILYYRFWEGEAEPEAYEKYKKMNQFFADLNKAEEDAFPFIPALKPEHWDSVKYFDQWNLHELLSKTVGGKLSPKLETAIEHYCWSSYACSSQELSAAAGLNFLAQEINPILIGAGGNAKVGERILERLLRVLPATNLRCNSIAVNVAVKGDHAIVTYEDSQKILRQIKTKAVIMACPKFVAARIIPDLEPERLEAISKLRYRSYMTANLLIKRKMARRAYDIFLINDGKVNLKDIKVAQDKINGTDFVMANFAAHDTTVNVLTFYRAFPYDGARAELNTPSAFALYKKKFEDQIDKVILPLMNIDAKDIIDLRLALWGHALPVAKQGIFRGDIIPTLRKPFKNRIFFIEQDNWAYPSTQTGATDVALMKSEISKFL